MEKLIKKAAKWWENSFHVEWKMVSWDSDSYKAYKPSSLVFDSS